MTRWHSPLMSVIDDEASTASAEEATCSRIVVPEFGWYGFSFRVLRRAEQYDKNESNIHQHLMKNEDSSCSCWVLQIITRQHPDNDNAIVVEFDLPLEHEGKPLLACTRSSSDIAKLVYLPKGATVTVVTKKTTTTKKQKMEQIQETANAERTTLLASAQWQLVSHRLTGRNNCLNLEQKMTPRLMSSNDNSNNGGSNRSKSLMCTKCARAFGTLQAIHSHLAERHYGRSMSSLTTDTATTTPSTNASTNDYSNSMWTQPLPVLYQDSFMAIVVKPQGMAVQGGDAQTLYRSHLLLALANNNNDNDSLRKPRPVHRLDAGTGGLLVVAKTRRAEVQLKHAFSNRLCHKTYLALVRGKVVTLANDDGGNDDGFSVCRHDVSGKSAVTRYRAIRHVPSIAEENDGWLTVVELQPVTGRRHQLRRHMRQLGHPIVGDRRYGGKNIQNGLTSVSNESNQVDPYSRLCLWAVQITVPHPVTKEEVICKMDGDPGWLKFVIQYEEERWKKHNEELGKEEWNTC